MPVHLNPALHSQQTSPQGMLAPLHPTFNGSTLQSADPAAQSPGWISWTLNSVLDSCSTLFRFFTSFFWHSTPNPFPKFEIPPLSDERKKDLVKIVEKEMPQKGWFDFFTASKGEIVQVLHQVYFIRDEIAKFNEKAGGNELIGGKVFLCESGFYIPFIFDLEKLDICLPKLIQFLSKIDTSAFNKTPFTLIEFSFCRITKPKFGALTIDYHSQGKWYSYLTEEKEEIKQKNVPGLMKCYSDDGAQRQIVNFLEELSILG